MSDDTNALDNSRSLYLDTVCDRFKAAWQCGRRPKIDEFLPETAKANALADRELLIELVRIDLEYRWLAGSPSHSASDGATGLPNADPATAPLPAHPRLADYVAHFPCLGPLDQLPKSLTLHEYLVRRRAGEQPNPEEYGVTVDEDTEPAAAPPPPKVGASTIVFQRAEPGSAAAPIAEALLAAEPARPAHIGRYKPVAELGTGSFGTVYRCRDEDLERDVAVKLFHKDLAIYGEVEHFLHEAKTAARLHHPGVVAVLDTGRTTDGKGFIVYEFVSGPTLQDRIRGENASREEAVRWVMQVAEALHAAHKSGIVHRDIKPANILIDEAGKARLTDFGIAKRDDRFFTNDVGALVGTMAYMSPEQASGLSHWATPLSDIYSLGAVLYEVLCRRTPFSSTDREELRQQVVGRAVLPPRTIDDSIPEALEAVCLKALAKKPEDRFTTARDMATALRAAVAPARRPLRYVPLAGMVVAALMLASLVWFGSRREAVAPPPSGGNSPKNPPGRLAGDLPQLTMELLRDGIPHLITSDSGQEFLPLRDRDHVRFNAELPAEEYVYLYWYNAEGRPTRLWPDPVKDKDPHQPAAVRSLVLPERAIDGYRVQGRHGTECALMAVTQKPLSQQQLAELDHTWLILPAIRDADHGFQLVVSFSAAEAARAAHRDLGQPEPARSSLSDTELMKRLDAMSMRYYGFLLPHK